MRSAGDDGYEDVTVVRTARVDDVRASVARDRVQSNADTRRIAGREGVRAHDNDAHLLAGSEQRARGPDLHLDGADLPSPDRQFPLVEVERLGGLAPGLAELAP